MLIIFVVPLLLLNKKGNKKAGPKADPKNKPPKSLKGSAELGNEDLVTLYGINIHPHVWYYLLVHTIR